jgi:hypothetical protein
VPLAMKADIMSELLGKSSHNAQSKPLVISREAAERSRYLTVAVPV